MDIETGRSQQKNRTRLALLAAARALLDNKVPVTVQTVADEAQISRATAYRYFSSADILMREALLDGQWSSPEEVIGGETNVRERVRRVQAYLISFTQHNETSHRMFLAKALESWVEQAGHGTAQLRGARRLPMYELALEPLRGKLTDSELQFLIYALSAASGIETYIALKDVCGVDDIIALKIAESNVLAILDRALIDART